MVFRDGLITIYRVERQRVLQPPQNMAERIFVGQSKCILERDAMFSRW